MRGRSHASRSFDGGYAEYTLVPVGQVIPFDTELGWDVVGALPEMFQTAYGSLSTGLELREGQSLLIRGGTSTVGCRIVPQGVDTALELVGTQTLPDTLRTVRSGGTVCFTGALSEHWAIQDFNPIAQIPTGVCLTAYAGEASDSPPTYSTSSYRPSPRAESSPWSHTFTTVSNRSAKRRPTWKQARCQESELSSLTEDIFTPKSSASGVGEKTIHTLSNPVHAPNVDRTPCTLRET